MPALDSARFEFVCQVFKNAVDVVTTTVPDASAAGPGPSTAQVVAAPSMKAQVNVVATNAEPGAVSWHAQDGQEWHSCHQVADKAAYDDQKWAAGCHNKHQWKSLPSSHDQWKRRPHNYDAKPLVDSAGQAPAQKLAFVMPCRDFFLKSCSFGDNCNFNYSSLTAISDEDF